MNDRKTYGFTSFSSTKYESDTFNLLAANGRIPKSLQQGFQKIIVVVLIAIALSVFLLLPKFVSEPWLVSEPLSSSENSVGIAAELSPSSQAQKTKYRQDAQFILAKILGLRDKLESQQASSWASFEFTEALNNIEQGDQHYARAEYRESIESYQAALTKLESLTKTGEQKLQQSLVEAASAIQMGQLNKAAQAVELASAIASDGPEVKVLQQRLKVLPDLLDLLQQGERLKQAGELQQAKKVYQQAADLDPLHQQAQNSLAEIEVAIIDAKFNDAMSVGYQALAADQLEKAASAFQQAATVYANNPAVEQAMSQLQSRKSQLWASRQFSKAKGLEQQEQWQQAVIVYEQMLATDPSLADVVVKKIPATVRADLDLQLDKVLKDPLKLSYRSNYSTAEQLLKDARSIPKPGKKLSRQISELEKVLKLSQMPVEVVFESDAVTEVKLFRVASLGAFEQKTLSLKSGSYTVAGSRKGFRDVRVDFIVNGEPLTHPIVIRCTEPI